MAPTASSSSVPPLPTRGGAVAARAEARRRQRASSTPAASVKRDTQSDQTNNNVSSTTTTTTTTTMDASSLTPRVVWRDDLQSGSEAQTQQSSARAAAGVRTGGLRSTLRSNIYTPSIPSESNQPQTIGNQGEGDNVIRDRGIPEESTTNLTSTRSGQIPTTIDRNVAGPRKASQDSMLDVVGIKSGTQKQQQQQTVENMKIIQSPQDGILQESESRTAVETIEEVEQIVGSADGRIIDPTVVPDASCIVDQSKIMIKSHYSGRNLEKQIETDQTTKRAISPPRSPGTSIDSDYERNKNAALCACTGLSLGKSNEIFTLTIRHHYHSFEDDSMRVLRYGDRVILRLHPKPNSNGDTPIAYASLHPSHMVLGVKRSNESSKMEKEHVNYHVALFSEKDDDVAYLRKMYQWTVIRYSSKIPIRVGSAAIRKAVQYDGMTQPVRAGDPILLRHVETGGVLSCYIDEYDTDQIFQLTTLTDSYNADKIRHTYFPNNDAAMPSLLTRLQQSDLLVPSDSEIFYFSSSNSPPTPLWLTTKAITNDEKTIQQREYLDGSYVMRHERNVDVESNYLDDESSRIYTASEKILDHYESHMEAAFSKQMQTPQGQEQLLLDELIGSFLGHEGEFIKAVSDERGYPLLPIRFQLEQLSSDSAFRFDNIFCSLVEEMLQLATSFVRVRHFVAQHSPGYEYGSVMQAMCESLDLILQEYMNSCVATVERQRVDLGLPKQQLTLRSLLVQIGTALHGMSVLERVCLATYNRKGGSLINSLMTLKLKTYRGDNLADSIMHRVLESTAEPYMVILSRWLECGELLDPYEEFMITDNKKSNDLDGFSTLSLSWESHYNLAQEHVLEGLFSTNLTVEQVLATGRYWNALRSCADTDRSKFSSSKNGKVVGKASSGGRILTYATNIATVSSYVQNLYHEASRALLRLLMDDFDLMGSLRLMKRYFLLEHGDFFVNFLDVSESELHKDLSKLSRGRIQHWLNLAVQLTERNADLGDTLISSSSTLDARKTSANKFLRRRLTTPAGLRCRFETQSLTEYLDRLHASTGGIDTNEPWTPLRHTYSGGNTSAAKFSEDLTGLEAFVLEFVTIPFPISLVLSPRTVAGYQLLFRHLFFAKHVERRLVSIWQDHQFMKELHSLRGTMGPTFLLRQRMLHFMQNLIYYMMFEVIEPNWLEMEEFVISATQSNSTNSVKEQTVDDILKAHNQFLQRALDACLLTNRDLVRALTKLMRTCLLFTEQMKRFLKATKIEDDRKNVADEMQKVVQRNLNDRRASIDLDFSSNGEASRKQLRKSIQKARLERQQRVQRQTIRVQREVSGESYQRMVTRFEEVFSDNLRDFMALLTNSDDLFHTHKMNLCIRLDYNGYVGRTVD